MVKPLVSCIMPTAGRRTFIPAAIDCWLKQTYEPRELVIVDQGDDLVADLLPEDKRIKYSVMSQPMTLGMKRNLCCEQSAGEIICHFDDDDWSAPDRIEHQVGQLSAEKPVAGFGSLYFWDVAKQQAKFYRASVPGYVVGTSLCYLKSFWMQHHFPDVQKASDNGFVYPVLRRIAYDQDASRMVARIHNGHTSPKDGIRNVVPRETIPAGFWDNERLRLNG